METRLQETPLMSVAPSYTNSTQVSIPQELQRLDQWLAYRAVPKPNGKINKPPIDAKTGESGSSTNPATWSTYELAAKRSPVGAAFVLTHDDPYFALDIDECVDPETGEITPDAQAIVDRFPIYWEVSYSHTGLRGIGRGVIPKDGCVKGNIEVYDHGRLVVMTGRTLPGHETIRSCQRDLTTWHNEVWPIEPPQPIRPAATYTGGSRTNEEILDLAFRAKNGEDTRRLYGGDILHFRESQTDKGFSSEADQSLISRLAFYTPNDAQLADLWRNCSLYRKRRDTPNYVNRTIQKARSGQSGFYTPEHRSNDHDGYSVPPAAAGAGSANTTCDAQLKDALSTIARQAETIKQQRETLQGIERILANDQIQIGPRVTGIALLLELNSQKQRGKKPKEHGHHIPAVWLARRTGSTAKTANSHVKKLEKMHLIQRKVVSEVITEDEIVDEDSGEIFGTIRKRAYYPADQASAIITNLAEHRRKDGDAKHGGKRIIACEAHPNAGTVKHWRVECAECHVVLDRGETYQKSDGLQDNPAPPTQDGSSAAYDDQPAPNTTRIPKMGHQTSTVDIDRPKMGQREMTGIPEEPHDFWAAPPPEAEPAWLWEGVGS